MAQSVADIWNADPETQGVRDELGLRALEADEEHALCEMHATPVNKFKGYWAGSALQFAVETSGNNLVNGPASLARGALESEWYGTHVSTSYLGNSRSESVTCESRWEVRGERAAVVVSIVRAGDRVLLSATSSYARR